MTLLVNPGVDSGWDWEYSFNCISGSVDARHDESVVYDLPYRGTHIVVQGFHGRFSHYGDDEYAVDFDMRVGTPVYAAREGIVVGIKSNNNQGGPDPKLANLANFIFIRHRDGTIGEYYHLRQGGVAVKIGDQIRRRQVIGYSAIPATPRARICISAFFGRSTEPEINPFPCDFKPPLESSVRWKGGHIPRRPDACRNCQFGAASPDQGSDLLGDRGTVAALICIKTARGQLSQGNSSRTSVRFRTGAMT